MTDYAKLKGLMAERGLTVTELAEMLGISRQATSDKVNGKGKITLTDAQTIASALHMSTEERDLIFLASVSNVRRHHECRDYLSVTWSLL